LYIIQAMADQRQAGTEKTSGGDRRGRDRRNADRRTPPPAWRRPWALVLYGVLGTLVVVLLFNRSRPPQIPAGGDDEVVTAAPGAPMARPASPAPPPGPPEDARRPADHERLMAEGEAAQGRWLRVELFCSSLSQVSLRAVDRVERPIAELADAASRVPAAECKWSPARGADPRPDVLLLVPPQMAESFAAAPMVEDGFVRRRRVEAVVEWVGRSDALALRTTLVLRQHPAPAG